MDVHELALDIQKHYFQWIPFKGIEPIMTQLDADETECLMGLLIPVLFQAPWAVKFPILPKHKRDFLKRLILTLERSGVAEVDEMFYHEMAAQASCERFYKSYFFQGQYLLSLIETEALVSRGTTGLQTWEAGMFLLSWLRDRHKILEPDSLPPRVLELGSGVGYTGIGLSKLGLVKNFVLTDCHPDVLETLALNCGENLSDSQCWSVQSLDWTQFSDSDAKDLGIFDVVIAADVVFDPSLVPHLVRTLGLLLKTTPCAFVACTPRNPATLELFLNQVTFENLTCSETEISIPNPDNVKIYQICSKLK